MMKAYSIDNPYEGVLIGTAVGDSLGLPAEGLSRKRITALGWSSWRQRFFFGKGMISDDTEHTLFVAQALLKNPKSSELFQKDLAKKLRWWLLSLPAGTGMATARAILKLWLGVSPQRSGVFSAGNGPAMRSGVIGAFFFEDEQHRFDYVKASTVLTHTDPKALTGALAVAELAALVKQKFSSFPSKEEVIKLMKELRVKDEAWLELMEKLEVSLKSNRSLKTFCESISISHGVSGYVYETVPVVIYAMLKHEGMFKESMEDLLNCGGDADTTGAILGSILGARGNAIEIPEAWVTNIIEWPRSIKLMKRVSEQMMKHDEGQSYNYVRYFLPFILIRNLFFLIMVLTHGFMRLLPRFIFRRIIR